MTITTAVNIAKIKTDKVLDLIEKRGNKNKISGLKISTLKELFNKGYCVKTVRELQLLGLIKETSICDNRRRIFSLSVNSIYNNVQLEAIR